MSLVGLLLLVSAVGQAAVPPLDEIGSTLGRSLVEGVVPGTASAAEVSAIILHHHGVACLVGERTYGKYSSHLRDDGARNRALGVARLEPIPATVVWPRQVLHRALPVTPAGTNIKGHPDRGGMPAFCPNRVWGPTLNWR